MEPIRGDVSGNIEQADQNGSDGSDISPFHSELHGSDSFVVAQNESDPLKDFRKDYPTDEDFISSAREESRSAYGLPADASSEDLYKAHAKDAYEKLSGPNTYSKEYVDDILKEFGINSLAEMTEEKVLTGLVESHKRYSGFTGDSYNGLEAAFLNKQMHQMKTGTLPIEYD